MDALGYAGKMLRVDLTSGAMSTERFDQATLREYVGGTSLGLKLLYEEVPPEVRWDDPRNRLIFVTGPLTGTRVMGSGTFSLITKGCMTGGATSTQANGFLGAYMKFSGFDGVILQGKSDRLRYLYLHDGMAEIRDASHLKGKGTKETEDLIKAELGFQERGASVFSIGPAGENLVRFAGIFGDWGHSAAHNGVGAVMGSKGLKAVVAARGHSGVRVADKARLATLAEETFERIKVEPKLKRYYEWGTSRSLFRYIPLGMLPVKNYTTSIWPHGEKFDGTYYRSRYELKPHRCWGCRLHHSHIMKVTEGPYTGYEGKEPEFEQWASWSAQIGQPDPGAAVVLANEVNELGMDTNEACWVIGLAMECYEKGVITTKDTDGVEMTWGNVAATRAMLRKIAQRDGFGAVLADGARAAAEAIGGEAPSFAVYTRKGNTPRSHDDRANWAWMLDNCTSGTGTTETLTARIVPPKPRFESSAELLSVEKRAELARERGSLLGQDSVFSKDAVTLLIASEKGIIPFEDSLISCRFCLPDRLAVAVEMLNAVTGWDFSEEEAMKVGMRAVNLMKAFNLRNGLDAALDAPSPRYGSVPQDGPARGANVMPNWPEIRAAYYEKLGWDPQTGVPLPETLREVGLGHIIEDLWRDG
ncbi:MAG: hypothetical protein HYX92_12240 [Chloroflexi bacterium]|nr:hypothetical protein [Chloroflexota bacterium]